MCAFALLANVYLSLTGSSFGYEGTVIYTRERPYLSFCMDVDGDAKSFRLDEAMTNFCPAVGHVLRVNGVVGLQEYDIPVNVVTGATWIANASVPAPPNATADDIYSGVFNNRPVVVTGIVRDIFPDEIDVNCIYLLLSSGAKPVYGVFFTSAGLGIRDLEPFVGRNVAMTGLCEPTHRGRRRRINRTIQLRGVESLRIMEPADDLSVPDISNLSRLSPHELANHGLHSASGRVLATWGRNEFLVRTTSNDLVKVQLASGSLPNVGSTVSAVGLPNTDLYGYMLSRATCRPHAATAKAEDRPTAVTLAQLLTDGHGHSTPDASFYGHKVVLSGTVRALPRPEAEEGRMYLEDDGLIIPVESSHATEAFAGLMIGSIVRISAVCILDTDGVPSNGCFPHLRGLFLSLSDTKDITTIAKPPWWTTGRLLAIIGALAFGLFAIFAWNLQLRMLSERRGRLLADEKFARKESELKVVERTRLAIELHDSMSQNLTGVSMEIRAAKRLSDTDRKSMHDYLNLALKTIDSSRAELRNCIWDLRNRALEMKTFNEAIRLTVEQHLGEATAQIRFNIPRERISDDVANAFLRIIRELVTNAVRHGKARHVRIAGNLENETLRFSVHDDGHGFDVGNCPGMGDGHFGLQGIRERIKAFRGSLVLTSSPGHGTKAIVTLPLTQSGRT